MHEYQYILVTAHLPGLEPITLAVLLVDAASDELHFRFRSTLPDQIEPEDADVIGRMADHCHAIAAELGARALMSYLLDSASNVIRVSDRLLVGARSASEAVTQLCARYIL
jgi:hypothetical protein